MKAVYIILINQYEISYNFILRHIHMQKATYQALEQLINVKSKHVWRRGLS